MKPLRQDGQARGTGSVLAVSTRAALSACERIGLDVEALLRSAGLSREALASVEARISPAAADRFWEAAYLQSGDPLLALHVAMALPPGSYRVLHYVCAHAPTLGEALERVTRYFPLVDARVGWRIEPGEPVALCMQVAEFPGGVPLPAAEYTLGAILVESRAATGLDWRPLRIELEREVAAPIRGAHARAFGCPVVYGAARTAMIVEQRAWDQRVPLADAALFSLLDRHADALSSAVPRGPLLLTRLRQAMAARLGADRPLSMAALARDLGMGPRTLQRRLVAEGSTFGDVLDEVRAAVARRLLADPEMALSEVALLLGYADQSAFSRAFRRWTGTTPAAVRRQNTAPTVKDV